VPSDPITPRPQGAPRPETDAPRVRHGLDSFARTAPAWQRWLVAGLLAIPLGWGTLIATFLGFIVFTGCFFTCSDPNPLLGSLLLAAAVACILGWLVTWAAGRIDLARRGAQVAAAVAVLGSAVLVTTGL
jgi:hypothetical protein